MFYYTENIPIKGTIVVVTFDETSDACVYVRLPEYNNYKGVIYHKELAERGQRSKLLKKKLIEMKRAEYIVCVVTKTPSVDAEGHSTLIELSTKGVNVKYHADIILRFKNIVKILKLFKFLAIRLSLSFDDIINEIRKNLVIPITEVNDQIGVDTLTQFYDILLRDPEKVAILSGSLQGENTYNNITQLIPSFVRTTNASSTLDFDLIIWKPDNNGIDAVYVLRDLFAHIKEEFKNQTIDVRYVCAPRYQLVIRSVVPKNIDTIYENVQKTIIEYLSNRGVTGYDLKFSLDQKLIQHGDISIAYPFQIDLDINDDINVNVDDVDINNNIDVVVDNSEIK